ncbi:high affinity immunoglobulin epsilon receptor subunit alpha-like, partial [Poecilia latipinna]|uniref:high affinity immunoglobulin epsilon receptor subunit alpha-like n=1 Tax=Poecilia latipinna TaxID=48699 RepID=UPI00072ED6E7
MSSANDSDACSVPAASCSIQYAFESHSGEYWCENHEGEKSRALNISVTGGSVILNASAQPVKEGSTVTLKCIQKDTEEPHFNDFYKDGVRLGTYYETDMMTFTKVTKSDEGLYKCTISRVGESPESWLAVVNPRSPTGGSNEEIQPLTNVPIIIIILLSIVFTLLFWVVGLILYKKHK